MPRQQLPAWMVFVPFVVCLLIPTGRSTPMTLQDYVQTYLDQQYDESTLANQLSQLLSNNGYQTACSVTCHSNTTDNELAMMYEQMTNLYSRCLTLAMMTMPEYSSEPVYVGIGSSRCVELVHDSRCFNATKSQCGWQYTARDLGPQYFPRFLLEVECSGCPASLRDNTCLEQRNRCEYTPREVVPEVLKRQTSCGDDGTEVWKVSRITNNHLTVGCSCTRHQG